MASWREADWVGDGVDALGDHKITERSSEGSVEGGQGEGLSNFVIEMEQEIVVTKAA